MKAKLRHKVRALIKELKIPAKLYRKNKLKAFRLMSASSLRHMINQLELSRPGTVVNDCDGVNHVVKGFSGDSVDDFVMSYSKSRGYRFSIQTQLLFEDGKFSCGCSVGVEPALSRKNVEDRLLNWFNNPAPGWPLSDDQIKLRDLLLNGDHVTDENGILLDSLSTMY